MCYRCSSRIFESPLCLSLLKGRSLGQHQTSNLILIYLEACHSGSVHAKPCQCHLHFLFSRYLRPCACNGGITVTHVIGRRGGICSLLSPLCGCLWLCAATLCCVIVVLGAVWSQATWGRVRRVLASGFFSCRGHA